MAETEPTPDADLVAAHVAGNRDAFAEIYDRYAGRVFSYHLLLLHSRIAAADATFDTFIEAAGRIGRLEDPSDLRPWLFSLARGQTRATERVEPPTGAIAESRDLREKVYRAVDELGDRDRQLLALHVVEGLEGRDLARAMGVEESHVRVMRARMEDRVGRILGPVLSDEHEQGSGDLDDVLAGMMIVSAPPALRPRVLDRVDAGVVPSAASRDSPTQTPAWMKVGVFALVTLAVGLLGFAVSGQFEPLETPTPVRTSVPGAPGGSSTTTSTAAPTSTSQPPGRATSSTVAAAPAVIAASTDTIDFGPDGTSGAFDLTNTGVEPGEWQADPSTEAITLSARRGELAGGESTSVDVTLDRDGIEEGDLSERVTVDWDGGQIEIAVVGTHEDDPIIHNPQTSPRTVEVSGGPECTTTQTTVSARIRDTSPLASVVARWSPDGNSQRETQMTPVGNDVFEAVIGPFTRVQSASVRIVAFDDRGNAGGTTIALSVVACP